MVHFSVTINLWNVLEFHCVVFRCAPTVGTYCTDVETRGQNKCQVSSIWFQFPATGILASRRKAENSWLLIFLQSVQVEGIRPFRKMAGSQRKVQWRLSMLCFSGSDHTRFMTPTVVMKKKLPKVKSSKEFHYS